MFSKNFYNFITNISFTDRILIKTHKNFCKLFYFKKKNFFRKVSDNKIGIKRILADAEGLVWYCKRVKKNKKKVIRAFIRKKNYSSLDTFKIEGSQAKSWDSLKVNFRHITKIYNHYIKFFPKKKLVHIHGDLTLDNVIIKKKKIFIIDWEFFKSNKNYYGYDLAYLFLSSLCIPFLAKKKISLSDEKLFIFLWKLLKKLGVNNKIIVNPFNFFENNIKRDKFLRQNYKLSKSKFYPFLVNSSYKKRIIKIIKGNI